MAIKRIIEIQTKGTENVNKSIKDIEKELKDVEKQAKKSFDEKELEQFNNELKKTDTAVKSVKNRLRELEDEMADIGDVSSPQFQKLSKEAGVLRDKINNAKAATKAMSEDFPRLKLGMEAFNAIGGAAQGAQGAAQLFGDENEELTKGIQKMMAVQSVLNGVNLVAKSLSDETALGLKIRTVLTNIQIAAEKKQTAAVVQQGVAQKGLKATIMQSTIVQSIFNFVASLNPIGLIIAGVVALGAAIALLWSPIKKLGQLFGLVAEEAETAAEANKKLTASMEAQAKVLERLRTLSAKVHENRMRELEIQDASEEEKHQATLERLKELEKERKTELQNLQGTLDNQQRLYAKAKRTEDFETARSIKTQIEADKARIIELKNNTKDYNLSRREEEKKFNDWKAEEDKKAADEEKTKLKERNDNYKAFLQERLAATRNIEDLRNELEKDEEKKQLDKRKLDFERELTELKGSTEQKAEQEKLLTEKFNRDMIDIKVSFLDEQIEIKSLETKISNDALGEQMSAFIASEQAKIDAAEVTAERQKALDKEVQETKFELAKQGFQLVGEVAELFANKSDRAARIAFNVQKAASIAQATMDGYKAVLSTYAQTPGGPILRVLAAGVAGAFALTNIKKIASTQFGGAGSPSGLSSGGSPSGGVGGGQNVANFNVVGNTGVNQLAESLGDKEQPPIKAFVVGSDVTTQQSLDRNKVQTATL